MGGYGVVLGTRFGGGTTCILHVCFRMTTSAFRAARLAVKDVTRRVWLLHMRLGMRTPVSGVRWKKLRYHRSNQQGANHGNYQAKDFRYGNMKMLYE